MWPGGKDQAGVVQRIINQIPPHDVFVSACLGDCAVLRRKRPAATSHGIDPDRENIERWTLARPVPGLQLWCCDCVAWMRTTFCLDLVWPQKSAAEYSGWFVYVDPPYLHGTRRSKKPMYRVEPDERWHAALLDTVFRLPCQVMVQHYPCETYSTALRDWRTFTYRSMTRGGSLATEQVWCNYPEPSQLHDSRFIGADKRERERIRRVVRNMASKLRRLPALERQAVLDGLSD
jgi:DNA adenine methylase